MLDLEKSGSGGEKDSIKNHKKTLLRVYKTTSHTNKIRIVVCVRRALLF